MIGRKLHLIMVIVLHYQFVLFRIVFFGDVLHDDRSKRQLQCRVGNAPISCGILVSKSWIVKKCKKIFYHLFNSVKYLYLPSDTFRKHVVMHVTCRKLALKFTGYCRQTSYTDSAVVFTLLPAVAWDLKSQFPGGYMHFNICFKGVSGKIGIFHNEKLPIEVFWFFCLSRSWQWAGAIE